MTVKVFAPLIGEGVEELGVVAWKKKLGDAVTEGEALVELESDKVVTELPSPATGTLVEISAEAGDEVKAGSVIAVIEREAEAGAGEAGADAAGAAAPRPAAPPSAAAPEPAAAPREPGSIRRRIAERMIASQRTSAHVLSVMEADLGAIVAHREANKEAFAARGTRLTLSAYFVSALAKAIELRPEINSSWSEEGVVAHAEINIGIAVSLRDEGLIVPVVKRADRLSLEETAREIDRLASAARTKTLSPEDVRGGTFTLTNHGTGGSLFASPIINQPQIGILGTGALQKRAVVVAGPGGADAIVIRPMIYLSLVFDHRAMDGEAADEFLRGVKSCLEGWA